MYFSLPVLILMTVVIQGQWLGYEGYGRYAGYGRRVARHNNGVSKTNIRTVLNGKSEWHQPALWKVRSEIERG